MIHVSSDYAVSNVSNVDKILRLVGSFFLSESSVIIYSHSMGWMIYWTERVLWIICVWIEPYRFFPFESMLDYYRSNCQNQSIICALRSAIHPNICISHILLKFSQIFGCYSNDGGSNILVHCLLHTEVCGKWAEKSRNASNHRRCND